MVTREIDFESIDWKPMESGLKRKLIEPNKLYGTITIHQKKPYIQFSIGEYVINRLGWKSGDRVIVHQDPNFEFNFLLVKSSSKRGIKMQTIKESIYKKLSFTWNGKAKLEKSKLREIKFKIIRDNQLAFQYYPLEEGVMQ